MSSGVSALYAFWLMSDVMARWYSARADSPGDRELWPQATTDLFPGVMP